MEDIRKIITEKPFFKGLDEDQVQTLVECASLNHLKKDQFLFKVGEEAKNFYLINYGMVALQLHTAGRGLITIQTLIDGDIVGWSWLFPPYKWNFDAQALENTELVVFDAKPFLQKCETDLKLGYEIQRRFSRVMLERLQATRFQLLDLYGVTHEASGNR